MLLLFCLLQKSHVVLPYINQSSTGHHLCMALSASMPKTPALLQPVESAFLLVDAIILGSKLGQFLRFWAYWLLLLLLLSETAAVTYYLPRQMSLVINCEVTVYQVYDMIQVLLIMFCAIFHYKISLWLMHECDLYFS